MLKYYRYCLIAVSQKTFNPPANVNDFDQSSDLSKKWDSKVAEYFQESIDTLKDEGIEESNISIFDPKSPPPGQSSVVVVPWGGFPNILSTKYEDDQQKALVEAEKRQNQDEYLEWAIKRDETTGKIKEIIFTCESPEYWLTISDDRNLLLKLYRKYADPNVQMSDLFPIGGRYNPKNKWNLSSAIHLIQTNNTLGAEIKIAADGTVLRKKGDNVISNVNELICCGGFGAPNRNSDPIIGSRINSAVRNGNWVSLRDPVGLYIIDINASQFQKPDGSPIPDFKERYWNVIRGDRDGSMILRASIKVPEDETINGNHLLLGDLLVNGEPIKYGGQVATFITVGLYATVIPGGPNSPPLPCSHKCCTRSSFPNLQFPQKINIPCTDANTPLTEGVTMAAEMTDTSMNIKRITRAMSGSLL